MTKIPPVAHDDTQGPKLPSDLLKWAQKRPQRAPTPGAMADPRARRIDMPKGIPGSRPPCAVPGCPKLSHAGGFCGAHYALWRKNGDPTIKRSRTARWDGITPEERFWAKVDRSGGPGACWPWTGARTSYGYGHYWVDSASIYTHRQAYELANGPIPDGLLICHHCDNPPCCNPAHLFLGTKRDNVQDMMAKGRNLGQWQSGRKGGS